MVSQKLLNELKVILQEDYGRNLKTSEVSKIGSDLVGLFELLVKNYKLHFNELNPQASQYNRKSGTSNK